MPALVASDETAALASWRPRAWRLTGPELARALGSAVALALWAWLLYALSWHTRTPNSDNANAVMAGRDLFHGNVLLRGWELPSDTFWSIDLPVYGLASVVLGISPRTLYLVPVLIGLAVMLVAWTCRPHDRGRVSAAVAVGVMFTLLGLPHPMLAVAFLQGPHHVGTTLLCLIAFRLLTVPTIGVRWLAGTLILGAAVLGDPLAIAIGAAPIAAAAALGWWRGRRMRHLLASVVGSAVSVAGAAVVSRLVRWAGGYTLAPPLPLSPRSNWDENLKAAPRLLAWLLGVGGGSGINGVYRAAHVFGLVVFIGGVAASAALVLARREPAATGPDGSAGQPSTAWLDDALLMGVLGGIAAFILIALPTPGVDPGGGRYLVAPLVYGAILAGRRVGDLVHLAPRIVGPVATALLVVVGGLYLATSVSVLQGPGRSTETADVAYWLAEHGLSEGYAQYWSASILTVQSRGRSRVRPVIATAGKLRRNDYYASAQWFRAQAAPATFVVVSGDQLDGVGEEVASATFGPAIAVADVGRYRIMVWDHDLRPDLGLPTGS